ncbi:Genetic interactor of prohibitins 3 mitochondrial [Bienertia sinuspersici]
MKNSHHYCYKKDDILSLNSNIIDVSGVCVYVINSTHVYFPKSRVKNKKRYEHLIGKPGHCSSCGMTLLSKKPALYCSLLCKLNCNRDLGKLDSVKLIMEQQDVRVSLNKNKKRKREIEYDLKKIGGKNSGIRVKINHQGRTVILGDKDESGEIVDDGIGKKMTYRKKARKGIPRRAPLF